MLEPRTFAAGHCPQCETPLSNVQGVAACPSCEWVRDGRPNRPDRPETA